jgi:hypothetical protein
VSSAAVGRDILSALLSPPLHMLDNICSILCSIYVSKNIESHLISKAIAHCSHRSIYLPLKCQHQIIKSNHWSPSLSSFITRNYKLSIHEFPSLFSTFIQIITNFRSLGALLR